MKKYFLSLIINVFLIFKTFQQGKEDLEINILPSDKYRLNKRDLLNLKSDLERQVIKRNINRYR